MTRPARPRPPIPRGRRAIAPPPRAGRAVAEVMSRFAKAFGAGFGEIAARWSDIVGEKTARMCAPVKLTGRGSSGVLHVAAIGPAALLVEADSQRILAQVNTFCGKDVAGRLAISRAPARAGSDARAAAHPPALTPLAKLKLEAELAEVDDPRLKAALLKLGRATRRQGSRADRTERT